MKKKLILSSLYFVFVSCLLATSGYGMTNPLSSPERDESVGMTRRKRKRKTLPQGCQYEPAKKRRKVNYKERDKKRDKKRDNVLIILNGITSTGKTTITDAMAKSASYRRNSFEPLDRDSHVAECFAPTIRSFWNQYYSSEPEPLRLDSERNRQLVKQYPSKYQDIRNFVGSHSYELANLSFSKNVIEGFLNKVMMHYENNKESCLIVDSAFGNCVEFKHWMKTLSLMITNHGWKVYFVKVACHSDSHVSRKEAMRRTVLRGDRDLSNIGRQISVMHTYFPCHGPKKRKRYDFTLYTKDKSEGDLVHELLAKINKNVPRAVLQNAQMIKNDEMQERLRTVVTNNMVGLDSLLGSLDEMAKTDDETIDAT